MKKIVIRSAIVLVILFAAVKFYFANMLDGPGSYRTNEEVVWVFANHSIDAALFRFRIDYGRYPTTDEGLSILAKKRECESVVLRPYLDERMLLDPWKRTYEYRIQGQKVRTNTISIL